jgi:c-di-GMP-binding flagellar brake protein YcgR
MEASVAAGANASGVNGAGVNGAGVNGVTIHAAGAGVAGPGTAGASTLGASSDGRENRRAYPRYVVDCPASVTLLSGAGRIVGRLADLSLGGCRMVTEEPVTLGILARVELSFDLRGISFRMLGVTAGTRAKTSFAMRFLEMPQRRVEALAELLAEVAVDPEGPKAPVGEKLLPPMEQAAAAKREIARRQMEKLESERLEAAKASLPAADARPSAAGSVGGAKAENKTAERRSHVRHGVDTRVNLTLVRGALAMPGCIVNLSQGGCRLRTDEHFKVGIYTRVEAEFFLHGLPFRLAGVSQAILDRNTIGIRFLDMSARKREQLTELIAEIEEMQSKGLRD